MTPLPVLSRPRLFRGFRGRRGASAVEFALIAPILCTLLVGLVDFGLVWKEKMQVQAAAQAGAEYAAVHGWNVSAIEGAETASVAAPISASPAPSESCGCPESSGVVAATCGSTCSTGAVAGTYATVSATLQWSTILPYPGLPSPLTLNGTATVRLQ